MRETADSSRGVTAAVVDGLLRQPLRCCSSAPVSRNQAGGRVLETLEGVLAAIISGESSRMMMLTPSGRGPSRLHGKDFNKEEAVASLSELKS